MNIEKKKLKEIKPNPANPRVIHDSQFHRLVNSILSLPKMLELRPIVTDTNMIVLGGNQRLRALQSIAAMSDDELKERISQVPDFQKKKKEEQDALVGFWLAWLDNPVCPSVKADELTDEEQRKFIIVDNAGFGEWDWDMLSSQWDTEELGEWGVDVPTMETESEKDVEEDDFDEENEVIVCRCKKGEIWQLGNHRLMCGDSTSEEDVDKLMGGGKADMVFTDPPYGVSYTDKNEYLNSLGTGHRLTKSIENDSKKPTEMYEFWKKCFVLLHNFTKEKMSYFITAPQGGDLLLLLPLQAIRDSGFMLKHQLVWNKNNHVLGRCDYNYKHEPIIYGWKIKGTHNFYGKSKFKTSVWDIPKPMHNNLHPTMKPIELIEGCMLDTTIENDSVLDLFGGSGSTLIAAEQLNRKCYMMELDEHYCDVIIARWEKLTGKTATKIE